MFLLDTDVVVALRGVRTMQGDTGLAGWGRSVPREQLFLSILSLIELESAARSPRDKALVGRRHSWIDCQLLPAFEGRILPIDVAVVRRRRALPLADDRDALLAATALEHGLTVATRRGARYKAARVRLLDPFAYAPEDDLDWRQAARAGGGGWVKNLFARG